MCVPTAEIDPGDANATKYLGAVRQRMARQPAAAAAATPADRQPRFSSGPAEREPVGGGASAAGSGLTPAVPAAAARQLPVPGELSRHAEIIKCMLWGVALKERDVSG